MSRIRVTVNDQTLMDADVSPRHGDLPDINTLRNSLEQSAKQAGGDFQLWSAAILPIIGLTIAPMSLGRTVPDTTITVETRNDGWRIDYTQA